MVIDEKDGVLGRRVWQSWLSLNFEEGVNDHEYLFTSRERERAYPGFSLSSVMIIFSILMWVKLFESSLAHNRNLSLHCLSDNPLKMQIKLANLFSNSIPDVRKKSWPQSFHLALSCGVWEKNQNLAEAETGVLYWQFSYKSLNWNLRITSNQLFSMGISTVRKTQQTKYWINLGIELTWETGSSIAFKIYFSWKCVAQFAACETNLKFKLKRWKKNENWSKFHLIPISI